MQKALVCQLAQDKGTLPINQTAALEVADVFASGALDHLDGELEQANFPGLIHSLDDRAIRITGALHYPPSAIDDRL
jgi:hypothetical protein